MSALKNRALITKHRHSEKALDETKPPEILTIKDGFVSAIKPPPDFLTLPF